MKPPDSGSNPTTLSWADVCSHRLRQHGLVTPMPHARPADVVSALGGLHAQVMSAAELAIGLRAAGVTRQDVRHALWTEQDLVKTYGPRGTVHLLPSRELPMWISALSAAPGPAYSFPEEIRLTPAQTDDILAAMSDALTDAELTIDELNDAIVARTGEWAGDLVMEAFQGKWPRWRMALPLAGMRGVLCFGPRRGRKVTYTNPARWMAGAEPVDGEAALSGVVRRFLRAYGPTTPQRFAQWMAAPSSWASEVFGSLAQDMREVEVERERAWVAADADVSAVGPPRGVRLLPYFDPYAYAVGNRRDVLYPGRAAQRAAGNFQVVLVDGVVGGVWHQRRSGRKLDITVEPLETLTREQLDEVDEQVRRIGEVLEASPTWKLGTVTVGGHA